MEPGFQKIFGTFNSSVYNAAFDGNNATVQNQSEESQVLAGDSAQNESNAQNKTTQGNSCCLSDEPGGSGTGSGGNGPGGNGTYWPTLFEEDPFGVYYQPYCDWDYQPRGCFLDFKLRFDPDPRNFGIFHCPLDKNGCSADIGDWGVFNCPLDKNGCSMDWTCRGECPWDCWFDCASDCFVDCPFDCGSDCFVDCPFDCGSDCFVDCPFDCWFD